ncbi:DNA-binding protein [Herminiimonas sp. NPDC097707]|uniref:DNA-binding protein n=1 Tax=Herminiimonas sp. NPDC097707 TaxID=3364007 RepID=UPI00383A47F1
MARAGILYSQVASVAAQLADRGINATVDNVREALGNTGSKSTIAPLLKRWKSEREERVSIVQTGLPADLVTAVKNLHEHLQHEAAQKVDAALTELTSAKANFNEQVEAARNEVMIFKTERDTLGMALTQERNAHEKLGAAYHGLQVIEAKLQAEATGLALRLQDHRNEIDNLQQQLRQTRVQFEHYQESIAVQRMEERRQFEHAKVTLEAEIMKMRRQLASKDMVLTQQNQQIALLKQTDEELQSSKSEYRHLEEEFLKVTQTLSTQTALATELSTRFEVASDALSDAQNKLAVLDYERTQLQVRNIDLEAKCTTLEDACQILRIEQATLKGQLHQITVPKTRNVG